MKKIMKNGKINGLLDVYGIIYLVRNKVNGKCYIGQTYQKNGFKKRYGAKYNQSLAEALYESHKQMINKVDESEREIVYLRDELLQEIEQYGIDAFEITEVIDYTYANNNLVKSTKTVDNNLQLTITNTYDEDNRFVKKNNYLFDNYSFI